MTVTQQNGCWNRTAEALHRGERGFENNAVFDDPWLS